MPTDRLNTLLECKDAASWGKALFALGNDYGFEQLLFGLVPSRHAKLEHAFLQSNYSPDWRERYDTNKLAYVDPTVTHCQTSTVPIVWAPETFRSEPARELYEEASAYGVRTGVTLPIHGPGGEFGVISFASDLRPRDEFNRIIKSVIPALSLIRDYAFESSLRLMGEGRGAEQAPRLTPRELEVLKWVMAGKSSWEISRITNCSEATVNFHMANVRQKFSVNTRQQAVVKAIALGLITPEDRRR
ncbi:MAG TPA: LuxR family transcriptional regulator [Telluria sp.]|nr:LuxR family transcriptional regulator [Telluria sp.]